MGSRTNPRAVVQEFFDRLETDDRRDAITDLFVNEPTITLPEVTFEGPDAPSEFLAYSGSRYEWIAKEFGPWITTDRHVVSQGTLYGVDNNGDEFEDVRYVDIYELQDGKINAVHIYNDLADEGIVDPQ